MARHPSRERARAVRAARGSTTPDSAPDDLFRDGKEPGALRTIGEVARALGLRQHVLRYWEDQFPTLRPLTRAGGRRYYRPADIALVREIDRLLHREGYTIRGARAALARPAPRRSAPARDALAPLLAAMVADPAALPDLARLAADSPETALLDALGVLRRHLETIRSRLARALAEG